MIKDCHPKTTEEGRRKRITAGSSPTPSPGEQQGEEDVPCFEALKPPNMTPIHKVPITVCGERLDQQ